MSTAAGEGRVRVLVAGVAFGGSYLAAKYGTKLGGWAYGRGSEAVDEHVFKPVTQATTDAAKGVVEAGGNLVGGVGRSSGP
jgi:hypothetical protein